MFTMMRRSAVAVPRSLWAPRRHFSGLDTATEVKSTFRTPELEALADSILNLNVLQIGELQSILAEKTGTDLSQMQAMPMAAAAAPVAAAAAGAAPAEEAKPDAANKDIVTLKLTTVGDGKKFPILKILRKISPGMNLMDSKKLVEELPSTIASDMAIEDAKKWAAEIEEAGGVVELV